MTQIKPGDKLPDVQLMMMGDTGPTPIGTAELFGGKNVALFAVPGAFTPTCSNQHLPSYITHAEALRAKGIDSIVCLSVNDVFVMDAWSKSKSASDAGILMLADGNGDFTKAMGLTMDGSSFGMGHRSQRFAMLVEDGTVKELKIEPNPAKAENSNAESLLELLG